MVCNCSRAYWKYTGHIGRCDISDNIGSRESDSNDSSENSDSKRKQNSSSVCIVNRQYLELGGPWFCAV